MLTSISKVLKRYSLRTVPISSFLKHLHTSKDERKNKMLKYLRDKIEATGPITIADYMKTVLINPECGYYMHQNVFGSCGDFITSPEISQIFGEIIAIWFYNEWTKLGKPRPFQYVEFGPGRGTLADDILRVFSKLNVDKNIFSVNFIEISPHYAHVQQKNLNLKHLENEMYYKEHITKHGFTAFWHPSLETVPDKFTLFLANEFFDALPIHKFQKTNNGWREVLIDFKNEELQFVLSRYPTPASTLLIDPEEKRNHIEVSPESGMLINQITKKLKEYGGISLIVDYGHLGSKTNTLRSFKKHELNDPLKTPGEADLTADVDFSYIIKCINEKAITFGPISQAYFLKNMGIDIRLEKLLNCAKLEDKKILKSGYDKLLDPKEMGDRFKFFAIYPYVLKNFLSKFPPVGFT